MTEQPVRFHYHYTFPDQRIIEFNIELDPKTLSLKPSGQQTRPDWTALSHERCANCPLREEEHTHCPVASNLSEAMEFFKDALSYEEVDVKITTPARTYSKHTAVQNGLSSMVGIYMVTSGCPILDRLRPMVRTHLPFATMEETTYRTLSMYLLAQYFLHKKGKKPDWDIRFLPKIFAEIQTVNKHFHKRLSSIHTQDAGLNAVVRLDFFARFTNMLLVQEGLEEIERLFFAYAQDN